MLISLVAAAGNNNVIGAHNKLPWKKMSADMKFFKNLTMGRSVIMGRKTFESLGLPLKERRNIIISRDRNLTITGCEVAHSLDEALELVKGEGEIFIVGGAEIFRQAIPIAGKIYLTRIYGDFEGDSFFPSIDNNEWLQTAIEEHQADEKNPYPFAFLEYIKKYPAK